MSKQGKQPCLGGGGILSLPRILLQCPECAWRHPYLVSECHVFLGTKAVVGDSEVNG